MTTYIITNGQTDIERIKLQDNNKVYVLGIASRFSEAISATTIQRLRNTTLLVMEQGVRASHMDARSIEDLVLTHRTLRAESDTVEIAATGKIDAELEHYISVVDSLIDGAVQDALHFDTNIKTVPGTFHVIPGQRDVAPGLFKHVFEEFERQGIDSPELFQRTEFRPSNFSWLEVAKTVEEGVRVHVIGGAPRSKLIPDWPAYSFEQGKMSQPFTPGPDLFLSYAPLAPWFDPNANLFLPAHMSLALEMRAGIIIDGANYADHTDAVHDAAGGDAVLHCGKPNSYWKITIPDTSDGSEISAQLYSLQGDEPQLLREETFRRESGVLTYQGSAFVLPTPEMTDQRFVEALKDVRGKFSDADYQGALHALDAAENIKRGTIMGAGTRGTIYLELGRVAARQGDQDQASSLFDVAAQHYDRAAETMRGKILTDHDTAHWSHYIAERRKELELARRI